MALWGSVSAPAGIMLSRRPGKRKQWSDKETVTAIKQAPLV